jgi:hypothetical protein
VASYDSSRDGRQRRWLGGGGGGRSELYIAEILPVSNETSGGSAPTVVNFQAANCFRVDIGRVRFGAKNWISQFRL